MKLRLKYNVVGIVLFILFFFSTIANVAANEEIIPEWKLEVADVLKWEITKLRATPQKYLIGLEEHFFWLGDSEYLQAKEGDLMEIEILDLSDIEGKPVLNYSAKCKIQIGNNSKTNVEMIHYGDFGIAGVPNFIWFFPIYPRDYVESEIEWFNNQTYVPPNTEYTLEGDIVEFKYEGENHSSIDRTDITMGYRTYYYSSVNRSSEIEAENRSREIEVKLVEAPGWTDNGGFFDIAGFESLSVILGIASVAAVPVIIHRRKINATKRKN